MKLLKRLEKKLKSNDQKDLLIEEYESHFSYQEKTSNLNISFNRVAFIFFIFLIIAIIFSTKAIYLGSLKKKITQNKLIKSEFRSGIVDNNGNIIAKTVITNNVGINPNLVIDKKKLLLKYFFLLFLFIVIFISILDILILIFLFKEDLNFSLLISLIGKINKFFKKLNF